MRRLNEILDFPKAWYKGGLVQRLFLGKEGSYATKTSAMTSEMSPDAVPMNKSSDEDRRRYLTRSNKKSVIERIISFLSYW